MVYYYTSNVVNPPAFIYTGKDKEENDQLIKHGWEEDVWYGLADSYMGSTILFHVHPHSSGHVYLRLQEGQQWDNIPDELLNDLGQLVKESSIIGRKEKNVMVQYTPWSNLLKTGEMATGEVSFHNHKLVRKMTVSKKDNMIIKRLEKTKVERFPDLAGEKLTMEKEKRKKTREAANVKKREEDRLEQERKEQAAKSSYDSIFSETNMRSNSYGSADGDLEDDFM
ncbi:9618_t:CDS:2 [Acaulospora morrowiae]|uniref:9618_t:CDS:1 n=1 Tax=Acaulospora morrowiae TaxID=94023 RepID=A0A9N8VNG7_9GLOM|nr:9618_t:CDS:2 [Acaulospora morrowiae]